MTAPTSAFNEREIQISAPAATKAEILASFNPDDFVTPTGREEDWRFTPVRRVAALFEPLPDSTGVDVVVNAPDSVTVEKVSSDDPRLGDALVPVDRASVLAWDGATEALVVSVPDRTEVAEPIRIDVSGNGFSYGLTQLRVGADSGATFVIDNRGSATRSDNIEVLVGDRSRVTFVSIQDWERDAVHLGRIHTRIGRDASTTQIVATFGGDIVRLVSTVEYDGPGGSADLLGAYFADAGQHLEHRLFADHDETHCRSNVVYKGALQGEHARTVWIGDVLIRANAVGTDTYEINRNLVLSDGARADSVPNLEIETGEIAGAGHASATGRFDDEQLFYLQSRGIPADEARRLVVRGFFTDVLDRIPQEDIRDRLWQVVEDEVSTVIAPAGGQK